ncbi:nucleoside triphosphate pyrophosphohydrolase [Planktothrix mougeotii]|uniref:Nucleoside triphosphate pyrophosphohydrolase n=1 Tax=Planktothrix mougeotii LEGE 06226 TaxID=1828728 RepID=A0ABR9UEB4_9CYAN|nr:nucleoside triphosphate pyrophosphohydrolase [Planktothrix mougeotii]MBE9144801.1 nucleoside triphosphate pyrophosphohydrolase [Planktothrix mougeotii LEGE 06226]
MRRDYNKLVRDRIPELIQKSGYQCDITTLSETEYRQALRDKILEEAQEVVQASDQELVYELADLLEVVEALMESYGIENERILLERDHKRAEKGGFEHKIKLLWTEAIA